MPAMLRLPGRGLTMPACSCVVQSVGALPKYSAFPNGFYHFYFHRNNVVVCVRILIALCEMYIINVLNEDVDVEKNSAFI